MDLNDFLIHSNALNIRLSRNLITQSCRDRLHEYINKSQLIFVLQNTMAVKGHDGQTINEEVERSNMNIKI